MKKSYAVRTIAVLTLAVFALFAFRPDGPMITEGGGHYHFGMPKVHAQYQQGAQWQTNDNYAALEFGGPGGCSLALTTGAFAANPANSGALSAPSAVRAATGNTVYEVTTSAAASALTMTCDFEPATRSTPGKGVIITGAAVQYAVQTTALTSITLPVVNTVTYPTYGGTASGTVAAAGGTITTNPAIGSAILTTSASGACQNQQVIFTTPVSLNAQNQRLTFEEVFNQTGGTATVYQICGVQVFYQNVVF